MTFSRLSARSSDLTWTAASDKRPSAMFLQLLPSRLLSFVAVCALSLAATEGVAFAQSQDDKQVPDTPATRRSGFFMGVTGGLSLAAVDGNPQAFLLRDDPNATTHTGVGYGYRYSPVIGAAVTDWLNLAIGGSFGSTQSSKYRSQTNAFIFHIEAFPLFSMGGTLRDLGVELNFGAGGSKAELRSTGEEVASTSVVSIIGAGAFWEPWRIWHFAAGPYLGYERSSSRTYSRDDVTIGLRVAFYGGP